MALFKFIAAALSLLWLQNAADPKPLTPEEATQRIDQDVVVLMDVKATKNRLEKRGEIYLDSTENFRDPKNLGIVITRTGAANFAQAGVPDPAEHFRDKTIQVKGRVILKEERPRIEIDDPANIELVQRKS